MTPVRGGRSVDSDSTFTRSPVFNSMPSPPDSPHGASYPKRHGPSVQSSAGDPIQRGVTMCHEWFMRRERRREERFDEELRYLLDEREHSEPATLIVEHDRDD